jgi:hypothetical protein
MIRKFLGFLAVLMIAVMAVWNVNFGSKISGMSDVMLDNVEALANGENPITDLGRWIVTIHNPTHWTCTQGGKCCCPDFDC